MPAATPIPPACPAPSTPANPDDPVISIEVVFRNVSADPDKSYYHGFLLATACADIKKIIGGEQGEDIVNPKLIQTGWQRFGVAIPAGQTAKAVWAGMVAKANELKNANLPSDTLAWDYAHVSQKEIIAHGAPLAQSNALMTTAPEEATTNQRTIKYIQKRNARRKNAAVVVTAAGVGFVAAVVGMLMTVGLNAAAAAAGFVAVAVAFAGAVAGDRAAFAAFVVAPAALAVAFVAFVAGLAAGFDGAGFVVITVAVGVVAAYVAGVIAIAAAAAGVFVALAGVDDAGLVAVVFVAGFFAVAVAVALAVALAAMAAKVNELKNANTPYETLTWDYTHLNREEIIAHGAQLTHANALMTTVLEATTGRQATQYIQKWNARRKNVAVAIAIAAVVVVIAVVVLAAGADAVIGGGAAAAGFFAAVAAAAAGAAAAANFFTIGWVIAAVAAAVAIAAAAAGFVAVGDGDVRVVAVIIMSAVAAAAVAAGGGGVVAKDDIPGIGNILAAKA